MAEPLLAQLALPLASGVALSFVFEGLLVARPQPVWQRPPAALAIHLGLWLLLLALSLVLFRRPWFAMMMALALLLPVILVSNAKSRSLGEPFIFQDFEYFTDAMKHPRLYLPFLNVLHVLLAMAGFSAAFFGGMFLEPPLTDSLAAGRFFLLGGVPALAGLVLLWLGSLGRLQPSLVPEHDLRRLGLLPSLWCYGWEERRAPITLPASSLDGAGSQVAKTLPHLIAVQSESFFDIRRLPVSLRPELLREYDRLKGSAQAHGALEVPAWGANTVRTEFAFLAGCSPDALGIHRFNPYRKLARQGVPTLATHLKRLGYRTVCVHPYPASFYRRDAVFPLLGFDEFVDIRSFVENDKSGPYVGDIALADKVCDLLGETSARPVFAFVITMENHGPLHLERVATGEPELRYASAPPAGCDDLTIYLRHLANADRMIGKLRARLEACSRPAGLCWFGDHVPIMPDVYDAMGKPDGKTDYVIWTNDGKAAGNGPQPLGVDELADLFLKETRLRAGGTTGMLRGNS